jgi:hypothetical protein
VVSVAKPILKGQYNDVSGSVALIGLQVQINSSDSWAIPAYDSGMVPWSVPEFDLANPPSPAPAYAGLADGQNVYWRIRFQDGAGLWSPWSAAAIFGRDTKGVLTVNNPPSGTPKVEDATPPIAWTFTGETQSAYQIQIKHKVNNVEIVDWDTKKITGVVTSLTVPVGAINEPTNTTYTVTVRIWDTKQRENTPGDPPYVEVVRDFTFIPGATGGTTGLTAVADAIRPKVVLTWVSSTFPDRFNVLRNGKVIAAALDPTDTFVSGTTHTWTDNSPSPGRPLTYQIQRVVNDVASATNSPVTLTVPIKNAIWLREPNSGLEVPIFTDDGPEFTLGAVETILRAIAPNAVPMGINQSLSGGEAPVTGTLVDAYGQTAQYWRDQLLMIRNLRVKRVYLTLGELTMQVIAQQFVYKQRASTKDIVFDIGFTVYQQDSVNNLLTSA